MRLEIWLVDFCEAFARVSRKRQCAKCVSAFRFSFMRVGKKLNLFSFIFILKPFFSVVIVSVSFFFFALLLTVGGMKRSGARGCEIILRYYPCQRELNLQIALKPLCFMTACYGAFFIFLSSLNMLYK